MVPLEVAAHVHELDLAFSLLIGVDWLPVLYRYLGMDCYLILRTSRQLADADPGLTGNLLLSRMVSLPSNCRMYSLNLTTDLAANCRGHCMPHDAPQ